MDMGPGPPGILAPGAWVPGPYPLGLNINASRAANSLDNQWAIWCAIYLLPIALSKINWVCIYIYTIIYLYINIMHVHCTYIHYIYIYISLLLLGPVWPCSAFDRPIALAAAVPAAFVAFSVACFIFPRRDQQPGQYNCQFQNNARICFAIFLVFIRFGLMGWIWIDFTLLNTTFANCFFLFFG